MLIVVVVLLVFLAASAYGLRAAEGGARWPFLVVSVLTGGALVVLVMATLIVLTTGRDTWNGWVSGSQQSETVTLWVLLVALPLLLVTCCALLVTGTILRSRQRRSGQTSSR
jgi:hypothetical protein